MSDSLTKRLWYVVNHPVLGLLVGILVAMSGLFELVALPGEFEETGVRGQHAMIALGTLLVLKALLHVLESVHMVGGSLSRHASGKNTRITRRLEDLVEHWGFHMLIAALLIVGGFFEVWQEWTAETRERGPSLWPLGLIGIGLSVFLKACSACVNALTFLRKSLAARDRSVLLLDSFGRYVATPRVELALAVFLIAVGLWDEWFVRMEREAAAIGPHHGLVLFGLLEMSRSGLVVGTSIELAADAKQEQES